MFNLPSGIVGAGLALQVLINTHRSDLYQSSQAEEMKRTENQNKRHVPAAKLIQCLWRMETGRREAEKELANILKGQQANGFLVRAFSNSSEKEGERRVDERLQALGAMYSMRRLKYLACRSFDNNIKNLLIMCAI